MAYQKARPYNIVIQLGVALSPYVAIISNDSALIIISFF